MRKKFAQGDRRRLCDGGDIFNETYASGARSSGAAYNPFRYRGYYYDNDIHLYYLNSRYYDAKIGRFINEDSSLYHNLSGYNMYIYCNNNPVMYVDYTGELAVAIIGFLGVCGFVLATFTSSEKQEPTQEEEERAKAYANEIESDFVVRVGKNAIDININTSEFLYNVSPSSREIFYNELYRISVKKAKDENVDISNLMSVSHIRWEMEMHLLMYGIFNACDNINLNREETMISLIERAMNYMDQYITDQIGVVPWVLAY